jgi:tripartite-type tricarboxylate transporter receptor subunit TctC
MKLRLLLCLAAAAPAWALAQTFPTKPIRVIVPFPPGGADVTARIILPAVQEDMGQAVVIENRAGANGIIGAEYVARQPADGYTLMWTASNPVVTGPITTPKETPYDPVKDFTHISKLLTGVVTVSVPVSLPVNTMKEFIDYAKANPGKLSFASVGVGSAQHIDVEILKLRAAVDLVHIPYKGLGQVMPDLVAGRVHLAFVAYLSAVQQLNAGKVKVLAVTAKYGRLPGVPMVEEVVQGWERLPVWSASVHGPASLPRPVLSRIHGALAKALSGEMRTKFENDGYVVTVNSPDEFTAEIRNSLVKTAALIKQTGIQVQ